MACNLCRTSPTRCPRCHTPVCNDHIALYEQSCVDCAIAYYDSRDRLHVGAWFALGFGALWLLYAAVYDQLPSWSARSGGFRAITTGVPALDVVIMFTVAAVFAGKAMVGLRRWWHRRTFVERALARARLVR
ncbi:MAG TPA: hypothetical protein VIV40_20360 [Kofleriaceae bacterium]